jgi:hypothetical protein
MGRAVVGVRHAGVRAADFDVQLGVEMRLRMGSAQRRITKAAKVLTKGIFPSVERRRHGHHILFRDADVEITLRIGLPKIRFWWSRYVRIQYHDIFVLRAESLQRFAYASLMDLLTIDFASQFFDGVFIFFLVKGFP